MGLRTILIAGLTVGAALLAPAGLAAQDAPQLEHVFTITAELDDNIEVGETVRGTRRIIPITGGTVVGEAVNGSVHGGAWDWQIDRPDGCTDLIADYFIETDDGAVINVVNTATICRPGEGEEASPIYTRPLFEPPLGEYEWLGRGVFVGRLEPAADHPVRAVRIAIYRVE